MRNKSEHSSAEWSTVRRATAFVAAIALLSAGITLLRWPADTGNAHWSEWLVFYGSPPFSYALLLTAISYTLQRWQVFRGKRERVRLPLLGIWVAIFIFTGLGTLSALLHPR